MIRRGIDLAGHLGRIRLVGMALERHPRLGVPGERRPSLLDELPVRPAFPLLPLVAGVVRMVVAEVVAGDEHIGVTRRRRGRCGGPSGGQSAEPTIAAPLEPGGVGEVTVDDAERRGGRQPCRTPIGPAGDAVAKCGNDVAV